MSNKRELCEAQTTSLDPVNGIANVVIIGGGVTGGAILTHMIDAYIEKYIDNSGEIASLNIDLIDSGAEFGYGVPYNLETAVFRLNQPAANMSLYEDQPGDFVNWLHDRREDASLSDRMHSEKLYRELSEQGLSDNQIAFHNPSEYMLAKDWSPHSFVPRKLYSDYLKDDLARTLNQAERLNAESGKPTISVTLHDTWVEDLVKTEQGSIRVETSDIGDCDPSMIADSAILATGHSKNNLLADLREEPGYADSPLTMQDMSRVCEVSTQNEDMDLLIVGTGQSMLDALGGIDALGYTGNVVAVSGNGLEPWPFDPAKHEQLDTEYSLKHFTKDNIERIIEETSGTPDNPYPELLGLLVKEVTDSEAIEAGPGHVFATVLEHYETICGKLYGNPELDKKFKKAISAYHNNLTLPERYETLQEFKKRGQFRIEQGRIGKDGIQPLENGGFSVELSSGKTLKAGAIINSASMSTVPMSRNYEPLHPLVNTAFQNGLVEVDKKSLSITSAAGESVYPAGPASHKNWGVIYTRQEFNNVAHMSLNDALAKANERLSAQPMAPSIADGPK